MGICDERRNRISKRAELGSIPEIAARGNREQHHGSSASVLSGRAAGARSPSKRTMATGPFASWCGYWGKLDRRGQRDQDGAIFAIFQRVCIAALCAKPLVFDRMAVRQCFSLHMAAAEPEKYPFAEFIECGRAFCVRAFGEHPVLRQLHLTRPKVSISI
jgi:hypothetical protein